MVKSLIDRNAGSKIFGGSFVVCLANKRVKTINVSHFMSEIYSALRYHHICDIKLHLHAPHPQSMYILIDVQDK